MIENTLGTSIVTTIKTIINGFYGLWNFLTTPIATIDLSWLEEWEVITDFLFVLDIDFLYTTHQLNLLFFLTTTGLLFVIAFKIIDLIIPT